MALSNKAKLSDQIKVDYVYDADGTYDGMASGVATDIMDMKDWDGCLVIVSSAGTTIDTTNYIASFIVESNTSATGAGTDATVASAVTLEGGAVTTLAGADMFGAATAAATAGSDKFLALDIRADQLAAGHRYIAAKTTKGGTLLTHIMYIRYNGRAYKDVIQGIRYQFQLDA